METIYLLIAICFGVYVVHLLASLRDTKKELVRLQSKLQGLSNEPIKKDMQQTVAFQPALIAAETEEPLDTDPIEPLPVMSPDETFKRALELVTSKQIPSALEFILNEDYGLKSLESERLQPVGYELVDGSIQYTFNFDGMDVKVVRGAREDSPACMPGDPFFTVKVDLLINSKLVFSTDALEEYDEYGFFTYSLWTGTGNVSCLLIDIWIEKIHELRRHLEELIDARRRFREIEEAADTARRMEGKVSLGPYADLYQTGKKS